MNATPDADHPPCVLIISTILPDAALPHWLPVADLASALRQAGYRLVFLHDGALEDYERCVSPLMACFDAVHHHDAARVARAWDPQSPGALPPADRGLIETAAALVEKYAASLVVAASPASLAVLSKLPETVPRVALLPRAFARAPRMLAAPLAREKAGQALREALAGAAAVVEDEGLRLEVDHWFGCGSCAVLPLGAATLRGLPGPLAEQDKVVAVGGLAIQAARRAIKAGNREGRTVAAIDPESPLDAVVAALRRARLVVVSAESGRAGTFAWQYAVASGVPVLGAPPVPLPCPAWGELDVATLAASIASRVNAAAPATTPATPSNWDAKNFAADLGLPPVSDVARGRSAPAALRRWLQIRLESCPNPARVGLLLEPARLGAEILAAAFSEIAGPGRVFARNPPPGLHGVRPLQRAFAAGIDTVLLDIDGADAQASMQRVVDAGLLPMPLAPLASWEDRAGLHALRGTRQGAVAYVGAGPVPQAVDLVLAPGAADPPGGADVVALTAHADPRRGRLLTLFAADDDLFWRRPPGGAVGYDRNGTAPTFSDFPMAPDDHPAVLMLAVCRHLGCGAVLLQAGLPEARGVPAAVEALRSAGIEVRDALHGGPARRATRRAL